MVAYTTPALGSTATCKGRGPTGIEPVTVPEVRSTATIAPAPDSASVNVATYAVCVASSMATSAAKAADTRPTTSAVAVSTITMLSSPTPSITKTMRPPDQSTAPSVVSSSSSPTTVITPIARSSRLRVRPESTDVDPGQVHLSVGRGVGQLRNPRRHPPSRTGQIVAAGRQTG